MGNRGKELAKESLWGLIEEGMSGGERNRDRECVLFGGSSVGSNEEKML
jgi:hypothetical protein